VQENDVLVLAPAPLADQGDQAGEPLAGIDRIERKRLEPAGKPDRLDGGFVRDPVGRPRMPGDDFHVRFVEGNIEQAGGFTRERHDIGAHPCGLGVDIDPDNPRVRHGDGGTDHKTRLRAGASSAKHDSGRRETL
jgi:hypothetical protein